MKYLYQAIRAWLVDWFLDRWLSLKAKTIVALKRVCARNTGDK
jgi:hypothetical protein